MGVVILSWEQTGARARRVLQGRGGAAGHAGQTGQAGRQAGRRTETHPILGRHTPWQFKGARWQRLPHSTTRALSRTLRVLVA